jgi:SnoaL-like protein
MTVDQRSGTSPNDGEFGAGTDQETRDRLALRRLVDGYAQAIDHRRPALLSELFWADCEFIVDHGMSGRPPLVYRGNNGLRTAFELVERYSGSMHAVAGQMVELAGATASGEVCGVAYEWYSKGQESRMRTTGLRYLDVYQRKHQEWRFSSRRVIVQWVTDQPINFARF